MEHQTEEIWKQIKDFNYEVSNYGNVRNHKKIILKPHKRGKGYKAIRISKDKKRHRYYIHRLVAQAFLDLDITNIKIKVDHIDNDKTNNRLENLQLLTHRENGCKSLKYGTSKYVGVCKSGKKWRSMIVTDKQISLGSFDTEEEAHQAYLKALEKYGIQNKYSNILKEKK